MKTSPTYQPFQLVSVDLAGPFVTSETGMNYILVFIDDFTSFIVLRALMDKSAQTVASTLWALFADFGVPSALRTDRGTEFTNELLALLNKRLGIQHRLTAAYNPRANGKAENAVKLAKISLFKMTLREPRSWPAYLPSVQQSLNLRAPEKTLTAPFFLMFGRVFTAAASCFDEADPDHLDEWVAHLRTITKAVFPALNVRQDAYNIRVARSHDKFHLIDSPFEPGSLVMRRIPGILPKSQPRFEGPFRVVAFSKKSGSYTIQALAGPSPDHKIPHQQLKLIDVPPAPAAFPVDVLQSTEEGVGANVEILQAVLDTVAARSGTPQQPESSSSTDSPASSSASMPSLDH
jgi:hypothetical protein